MYGNDGSYILMNNQVGFVGYDKNNNEIFWVNKDEFHQKKSVVEEEITLCSKMRFIPISITDNNDGIGLVSVLQNNSTSILDPVITDELTEEGDTNYYDVKATNPNSNDAILYYKSNDETNYNATTIEAGTTYTMGNYEETKTLDVFIKIKKKVSNNVSW